MHVECEPVSPDEVENALTGECSALSALRSRIPPIAAVERTTLIAGATGSGKDVVARMLHRCSARRKQPFVVVHCGALPEALVEAELFGHSRGAFTGATQARAGLIRSAAGGTLFLDEIDSLSLAAQVKLLRFLELGEYRAVGADHAEHADVWVLAATNQDLWDRVETRRFRSDLLFRLDVVRLDVPSLSERGKDVLLLATRFLEALGRERQKRWQLGSSAIAALLEHDWPGNVRELKNRIESAALLCPSGVLEAADLGIGPRSRPSTSPARAPDPPRGAEDQLAQALWALIEQRRFSMTHALAQCERLMIEAALREEHNNKTRAAARLGIHVRTIYKKLEPSQPSGPMREPIDTTDSAPRSRSGAGVELRE